MKLIQTKPAWMLSLLFGMIYVQQTIAAEVSFMSNRAWEWKDEKLESPPLVIKEGYLCKKAIPRYWFAKMFRAIIESTKHRRYFRLLKPQNDEESAYLDYYEVETVGDKITNMKSKGDPIILANFKMTDVKGEPRAFEGYEKRKGMFKSNRKWHFWTDAEDKILEWIKVLTKYGTYEGTRLQKQPTEKKQTDNVSVDIPGAPAAGGANQKVINDVDEHILTNCEDSEGDFEDPVEASVDGLDLNSNQSELETDSDELMNPLEMGSLDEQPSDSYTDEKDDSPRDEYSDGVRSESESANPTKESTEREPTLPEAFKSKNIEIHARYKKPTRRPSFYFETPAVHTWALHLKKGQEYLLNEDGSEPVRVVFDRYLRGNTSKAKVREVGSNKLRTVNVADLPKLDPSTYNTVLKTIKMDANQYRHHQKGLNHKIHRTKYD